MGSLPDDADEGVHRLNRFPVSYLYVIVVGADRIKVGVSITPEQRLARHRQLAEAFGTEPGRHWISYPGAGSAVNEGRLIDFCAKRATGRFSREYFSGLTFGEVVEYAESLGDGNRRRRGKVSNPRSRMPARLVAFEKAAGQKMSGTVAETATWLGLSQTHILKLVETGELTIFKSNLGDQRIPVMAMRKWLMQ